MARTVQTNVEDACRKMLDQAEVRLRGAVVFSTQLKRGVADQQPSACHMIKLSTSSSPTGVRPATDKSREILVIQATSCCSRDYCTVSAPCARNDGVILYS